MEDNSQFKGCLIEREKKLMKMSLISTYSLKLSFHPLLHVVAILCFICYAHSSNINF